MANRKPAAISETVFATSATINGITTTVAFAEAAVFILMLYSLNMRGRRLGVKEVVNPLDSPL